MSYKLSSQEEFDKRDFCSTKTLNDVVKFLYDNFFNGIYASYNEISNHVVISDDQVRITKSNWNKPLYGFNSIIIEFQQKKTMSLMYNNYISYLN